MTLALIEDARSKGATLGAVCARLGVSARTIQRWKKPATAEDRRCGPRTKPANSISQAERKRILEVANSEEFRDLSPKQIVPRLADRGEYIASESTFYRVLRAENQLAHRGKARAPSARPRPDIEASAPNQVYSCTHGTSPTCAPPSGGPTTTCISSWTCTADASSAGRFTTKSRPSSRPSS